MTSPFSNTTDPKALAKLVREGVECERCEGAGKVIEHTATGDPQWFDVDSVDCPTCSGKGRVPMASSDIEALCACWCYGKWVYPTLHRWVLYTPPATLTHDEACGSGQALANYFEETMGYVPAYTTNPVAAMQLQVKYDIEPGHLGLIWAADTWVKHRIITAQAKYAQGATEEEKIQALCQAIATCALLAALEEAGE